MTTLYGQGVSKGCAIGRIALYSRRRTAPKESVSDAKDERMRLSLARERAMRELDEICVKAEATLGESSAEIFRVHRMMLSDRDYLDAIERGIEGRGLNAEAAVEAAGKELGAIFAAMDDPYMQARSADLADISARLLACLSGETFALPSGKDLIICADDLSPSETVSLDRSSVLALVTAFGSASSHTAILAKSLGIPAIVGVGRDLLSLSDGETAIVDGDTGALMLSPSDELLQKTRKRIWDDERRRRALLHLRDATSETLDGKKVLLYANVEGLEGVGRAKENGAEGIGLFRSELLYLGRDGYPSEQEQFEVYSKALTEMKGKRTVVRTLDVGADKSAPYLALPREENPALGLRAIRFCLLHPEVLKTQLRALYRASRYGRLSVMFPMITSVQELREVKGLAEEVKRELCKEGESISEQVELGIMIETPAAALISDKLAPMVDFFSVGTNDLIQYTLACDRGNEALARFCDPHHDAVLSLIALSAKNAHAAGKWIGICGELAADPAMTEHFLRLGIDELSVSPGELLLLRERIRALDLSDEG